MLILWVHGSHFEEQGKHGERNSVGGWKYPDIYTEGCVNTEEEMHLRVRKGFIQKTGERSLVLLPIPGESQGAYTVVQ